MPSGIAAFHSESQKAPELSAQPQLAVRRAGRLCRSHMRVFSECATMDRIQSLDFVDYAGSGALTVNSGLLSVVLRD
jgi:hypothetical protein